MNIWEILEIPATTDVVKIKKAFSLKSAQYHPEEHPNEFHTLYRAYKSALSRTENNNADEIIEPVSHPVYEEQILPAADPVDVSYQDQWKLVEQYQADRQRKVKNVIESLNSFYESKESSEIDIEKILKSAAFSEVKDETEVIQYLVTMLHERKIITQNIGLLLWQTYQLDHFPYQAEKNIYSELYEFLDFMRIKWQKSEERSLKNPVKQAREARKRSRGEWILWVGIAFIIFCIKILSM